MIVKLRHSDTLHLWRQNCASLAYASVFQTLTDEQAVKLVDEYYDIQDDRLTVMKKMAVDVGKVLPGKKAFRYLQVEAKLSAIGRYELAKEIPLAR